MSGEQMRESWLDELDGSHWHGQAELWLDPSGNDVDVSECTLSFNATGITYGWSYGGTEQSGFFRLREDPPHWSDTWHQPDTVACTSLPATRGLFALEYSYTAGEGPDWGWRSQLSQRPDGSLVLQMTNIAPWGEEGRAVRMIVHRVDS